MATSPTMPNPNVLWNEWASRCLYYCARRLITFQCTRRGHQFPSRLPVRLLHIAAEQGNRKAMSDLGIMLFSSGACRADKRNGLEYLRRAAKLGDADAQFTLGEAHFHGSTLIKPNRQMASHWFALAADNGHLQARDKLSSLRESDLL